MSSKPNKISERKRTYNAYNTTDPAMLLELKRQEARIMLEIVRSMHPNSSPQEIIDTVVGRIIYQLDVNKLLLITHMREGVRSIEANHHFPTCSADWFKFLDKIRSTTPVTESSDEILLELGVEYVIPLGRKHSERPLGWILIADFADSEAETINDVIFIETAGNFLMISLENMNFFEERVEQERLQQELEVAAKIQKKSLPTDFNFHKALDIYAINIAHFKVAGDFYDVIPVNQDEMLISMADVSGKGIAAALLVASLQANLRAQVRAGAGFREIVKQLHEAVSRLTESEHFVTLFLGRLNVRTREMEYINAGHNPPYHIAGNKITQLTAGCIPLGMLPIIDIEVGYESFQEDSVLFLYTDGIVEQMDESEEMVGEKAIEDKLLQTTHLSAKQITEQVLKVVWAHAEDMSNTDDMSILVIKFLASI